MVAVAPNTIRKTAPNKGLWCINSLRFRIGVLDFDLQLLLALKPRSGFGLQPNVAAQRLRWVELTSGRNPIGVAP
jgi:hypothetical protein